jgi:hypothetical protein
MLYFEEKTRTGCPILVKETEEVPGSNSSNNPATFVQITKKKDIKSGHITRDICRTVSHLWEILVFQNI